MLLPFLAVGRYSGLTSKIGLNIHSTLSYGRGYSAQEKETLFAFLHELQPTTVLALDNFDWAKQIKARLPGCAVVFRKYRRDDGALHRKTSGREYARSIERYGENGVIVSIFNEVTGYGGQNTEDDLERVAAFMAEASQYLSRQGIYHCGPEWGVGHPDLNRLSELDELYQALAESNGYGYHSSHEYGTWRGMRYSAPPHTFDVYPWRVGRYQLHAAYIRQQFGRMPFQWLINEWGRDASLYPGDDNGKRGWKDSIGARDYALELVDTIRAVYTEEWLIGANIFSYGNSGTEGTSEDWFTHDISGESVIRDVLLAYSRSNQRPTDEGDTEPSPVVTATDIQLAIDAVRGSIGQASDALAQLESMQSKLK